MIRAACLPGHTLIAPERDLGDEHEGRDPEGARHPAAQRERAIAITAIAVRYMKARWTSWMSASRDCPNESGPWPCSPGTGSCSSRTHRPRGRRRGAGRHAVVLGAGDVATGDDRGEHQARGHERHGAQPAHRRAKGAAPLLGAATEDEEQAEEQHRGAEVGGDELVLEPLPAVSPPSAAWASTRPIETSEPRTSSRCGRRRLKARQATSAINTVTTVAARRWVNSTTDLAEWAGSTPPSHSGQPWVRCRRRRSPARSPDADDPADQDQGEGGDDGDGDEAAKAGELHRIAGSGDCAHRLQATGAESPSSESDPASGAACASGSGAGSAAGLASRSSGGRLEGFLPAEDRLPDVVQGLGPAHVGDRVEVVRRGRRQRVPLERRPAPRVGAAGGQPVVPAVRRVAELHEQPDHEDERPDRGDEVVVVEAGVLVELEDVHRLAEQAGEEHRDHVEMDPDHHQHQGELAGALAEQAPAELREPVVQRREAAEDPAADQHVERVPLAGGRVVERPADRGSPSRRTRPPGRTPSSRSRAARTTWRRAGRAPRPRSSPPRRRTGCRPGPRGRGRTPSP